MRIVVTDTALVWNHENPLLEPFKDVVLVVCLHGKAVTDKYECFVSPYKHITMGIDKFGVESQRYQALESVADELNQKLNYHEDVLFLTDGNPESLYPFYVIKDRNKYNSLHLVTMSPWNFESKRRIQAHKELLSDLSSLYSILYMDSERILADLTRQTTYSGLVQKTMEEYAALLPRIINGIHELEDVSFFDFKTMSYVPLQSGYEAIDLNKKIEEVSEVMFPVMRECCTLGLVLPQIYPKEDEDTREEVKRTVARIDGKKVCNFLREQRIRLAEENGILFYSEECPTIGPCAGTCQKCDQEAEYLRMELEKIPEEMRVYPQFDLSEWEV